MGIEPEPVVELHTDNGVGAVKYLRVQLMLVYLASVEELGSEVLSPAGLVVFVQVRLQGEGFVAVGADVRLLGGVQVHVGPQVGPVPEGLAAVGAAVGLFPRVGAQVALQQPGPGKALATQLALVLQLMCQHVHGKSWHGHVYLVALLTGLGSLAVHTPVRLFVSRQIRTGRVLLATLIAFVFLVL